MAKILVVDDHPINRQFLVKLLGYVNHTVTEAADGRVALAMVQADRPDLVITDIVMPNMDGPTFIKEMRSKAGLADIPVIFYTASYRVPDAKHLADECGVSQIMHKPAKPEDVLDAVNVALTRLLRLELLDGNWRDRTSLAPLTESTFASWLWRAFE